MARAKTREQNAKLLDDGTLLLYGVIGDEWDGLTAAKVVEEIRSLGEVDELEVLINSPGGSVYEGLAIHTELATHPANVVVTITGLAASMGSAIAMAGNQVRIAKNGMVMIHNPWNVAVGDAEDLRKAAEVLDKFGTSLVGIYAQKTGLEEAEIRSMMDEETWLDADEALAMGFVDEIIEPSEASAFAELDISELGSAPERLVALIREGRQVAKTKNPPAPAAAPTPPATPAEPVPAAPDASTIASEAAAAAVAAERQRMADIRAIADRHQLDAAWVASQETAGHTVEQARAAALDVLAARQDAAPGPNWVPGGVGVSADERDKFLTGAASWLIMKAGRRSLVEGHTRETLDPGEFRGFSLLDLARESMHRAGRSTRGMSKMEIAAAALQRTPQGASMNTRSDFPVLLENVLHKMLLAAYATQPDTWRRFCAEGSVSDFRPHPRLRLGSFSQLDSLLESGEFKQKHFPDAEKETIQAATKGNIVGLTRQAIVDDDVDGFSRLVTMLGRAAALSIEVDVYALLALNSGLGPTMTDTNPLFHARTNADNIGTGAALSAASIEADRVKMASIRDPEGNEILDIRPKVWVGPIGSGGTARQINASEYDPDGTSNTRAPNVVRGLFDDIVDTPRLAGTRYYLFADPAIAPVIEVVFLDGMSTPQLETEEGFDYDGVRWRVRHDYGVDATDFRGALTNAGTT